jgi:hypothetical protein
MRRQITQGGHLQRRRVLAGRLERTWSSNSTYQSLCACAVPCPPIAPFVSTAEGLLSAGIARHTPPASRASPDAHE